eukprot:1177918-Prorocentrum_minimum.AAC.5
MKGENKEMKGEGARSKGTAATVPNSPQYLLLVYSHRDSHSCPLSTLDENIDDVGIRQRSRIQRESRIRDPRFSKIGVATLFPTTWGLEMQEGVNDWCFPSTVTRCIKYNPYLTRYHRICI